MHVKWTVCLTAIVQARSKFADGQHAEIMEVLRLGELEVERSMANPFRRFTAVLTEVCDLNEQLIRTCNDAWLGVYCRPYSMVLLWLDGGMSHTDRRSCK